MYTIAAGFLVLQSDDGSVRGSLPQRPSPAASGPPGEAHLLQQKRRATADCHLVEMDRDHTSAGHPSEGERSVQCPAPLAQPQNSARRPQPPRESKPPMMVVNAGSSYGRKASLPAFRPSSQGQRCKTQRRPRSAAAIADAQVAGAIAPAAAVPNAVNGAAVKAESHYKSLQSRRSTDSADGYVCINLDTLAPASSVRLAPSPLSSSDAANAAASPQQQAPRAAILKASDSFIIAPADACSWKTERSDSAGAAGHSGFSFPTVHLPEAGTYGDAPDVSSPFISPPQDHCGHSSKASGDEVESADSVAAARALRVQRRRAAAGNRRREPLMPIGGLNVLLEDCFAPAARKGSEGLGSDDDDAAQDEELPFGDDPLLAYLQPLDADTGRIPGIRRRRKINDRQMGSMRAARLALAEERRAAEAAEAASDSQLQSQAPISSDATDERIEFDVPELSSQLQGAGSLLGWSFSAAPDGSSAGPESSPVRRPDGLEDESSMLPELSLVHRVAGKAASADGKPHADIQPADAPTAIQPLARQPWGAVPPQLDRFPRRGHSARSGREPPPAPCTNPTTNQQRPNSAALFSVLETCNSQIRFQGAGFRSGQCVSQDSTVQTLTQAAGRVPPGRLQYAGGTQYMTAEAAAAAQYCKYAAYRIQSAGNESGGGEVWDHAAASAACSILAAGKKTARQDFKRRISKFQSQ